MRPAAVHFTVIGGNEAGVHLVLIQPFLFFNVNHDVKYMKIIHIELRL